MSFTADPHAIDQLKNIIRGTLSANNHERNQANDALIQARQQPEIENYLFHILVVDDSAKSDIRAAAGINLKNSILKKNLSVAQRQHLLDSITDGLMSPDNMVRNTTGNVITSLFSIYGLEGWPQALTKLVQIASTDGDDFKTQEAAMGALAKICEDSAKTLDCEFNGERPLDFLMSHLVNLATHEKSGKIRALTLECVNYFIPLKSQSFIVYIDVFLSKLFQLAHDPTDDVKKYVCKVFASILETRADKLLPHLDGVITYCLHLMQDDEEEVALEACEFLLALATSPEAEHNKNMFKHRLGDILPVLLQKMVYSEEEVFFMRLVDDKDDADVADRDEDIKPQNAKSKDAHKAASKNTAKNNKASFDDDSDSDYDLDDDDDDEMELDHWSVRKCGAATLDIFSLNLPTEVLEVSLPILQERIVSPEWQVREAAILAFGAISKSCIELSRDKLPTLVPFLVDRLKDEEPRVRQISCWTISRFASWVAEEAHEGGEYSSYFDPTFHAIIACSLDKKKVVQEAACSALSAFIEETDPDIIGAYLPELLKHFTQCFETYQRKNMIILYDCFQTFVEAMGHKRLASKSEYVDVLLPPLLSKWQMLDDQDPALWPLLECMASVAATLGELFAPYAVPVYERAIKILSDCIQIDMQCQTDPLIEAPEKDFIVTSLDLIDGLIQGFGSHSADLIQQHNSNLMELVLKCFEDHTDDVRQSAYALLGDLAIFLVDNTVAPYLDQIMVFIGNEINNRSYNSYPVYNNAIWALGEIVMRLPFAKISSFMGNLVDLLIPVINSMDTPQTVLENAAICLGRMGITGGAEVVAPRLPEFILQWCSQMLYLIDNNEKETGFQGMLNIINANPDQGFGGLSNVQGKKNLAVFVSCIANYLEPPHELKDLFGQLLISYKTLLGDDVFNNQVLNQVDAESRHQLYHVYGI